MEINPDVYFKFFSNRRVCNIKEERREMKYRIIEHLMSQGREYELQVKYYWFSKWKRVTTSQHRDFCENFMQILNVVESCK